MKNNQSLESLFADAESPYVRVYVNESFKTNLKYKLQSTVICIKLQRDFLYKVISLPITH